jgi:hypothetical protein
LPLIQEEIVEFLYFEILETRDTIFLKLEVGIWRVIWSLKKSKDRDSPIPQCGHSDKIL